MQASLQPVMMTIAGSDSGAGAGIQADIKMASALGVYCTSAITAITAQNSLTVDAVYPVPAPQLRAQIDAITRDFSVAAIKLGMLADHAQLATLLAVLHCPPLQSVPVIMDTPLRASAGADLLQSSPDQDYWQLLARAELVTPNLTEAARLLNQPQARDRQHMQAQAEQLLSAGCRAVLLKGGHLPDQASDLLLLPDQAPVWFSAGKIASRNQHGTGCTLASAIAALRVRGLALLPAVQQAKAITRQCIEHSAPYRLGQGNGPLWHFSHPLITQDRS